MTPSFAAMYVTQLKRLKAKINVKMLEELEKKLL